MTEEKKHQKEKKLIVVVRIAGEVKKKPEIVETLDRLRLRRKYSCVLVRNDDQNLMGMVDKVKHQVAFGEISREVLEKLVKARAQLIDKKKKIHAGEVTDELILGKEMEKLNLKPFFRLHPPRGGIDSKIQFANGGILGNNKEKINELVERML